MRVGIGEVPRALKDKGKQRGWDTHKLSFCSDKGEFTIYLESSNSSIRGTLEMTLSYN